jgi:uroporphyrinogen-III synthase
MRVLITRPRPDAEALAALLRERGIESLIEPLLEIIPTPVPALDLDDVQALLLTSANGARALAHKTDRRDLVVFVVGPATAATARDAGFADVTVADGDVAALADLVESRLDAAGGALLHVSGSAVAGDLAGRLGCVGFEVRRAVLYEARPATALSDTAMAAIAQGDIDSVLLFSPRTAESFVRLSRQASLALDGLRALCLSPAVADQAEATPWGEIAVAARPDQDALLALIQTPPGD